MGSLEVVAPDAGGVQAAGQGAHLPRVIVGIPEQGRPWAEWFLSSLPYFLKASGPGDRATYCPH